MRTLLLFIIAPLLSYSQNDTTVVYFQKEVHSITLGNDTSFRWTIDTIKYEKPFEIKFTKKKVSVDGIGDFKIAQYELRKEIDGFEYRWYKFSNGAFLIWMLNVISIEYPVANKKTKSLFFDVQ